MANTQTNLMLTQQIFGFNTGAISTGFKPGIPVGLVFSPAFTRFTEADMLTETAFIAAVLAKVIAQGAGPTYSRNARSFALTGLDGFKPDTKKTTSTDTGLYQEKSTQFPNLWNFIQKGAQNNWSNYVNLAQMSNLTGYGFFVIDGNGNWWGTQDSSGAGGLQCYTLQQLFTDVWMPQEAGQITEYPFTVEFASVQEFTNNFAYFACPSLSSTNIVGLENVVLQTAPAAVATAVITAVTGDATKDVVVIGKFGEGSADFFKLYGSILTAACFAGYDYTAAAAYTIATFTYVPIAVAGVTYHCGYFHASAAPGSGHVVQIATTVPATVYGVISNYVVTEILNSGIDGQRAAVKTF